MIHWV